MRDSSMDVEIIRKQINDLLAVTLAEDDILRASVIKAETDAHSFLRRLMPVRAALQAVCLDIIAELCRRVNEASEASNKKK